MNNTKANNPFTDLLVVCKAAHEYLKKNYDSHYAIIISWDGVRIVRDEIGLPKDEIKNWKKVKVEF